MILFNMKNVGLCQIAPQTDQTAQVYCNKIFKMLVCFDGKVIILQNVWRKNVKQDFIAINNKSIEDSWKTIMPIHIAYMIMGILPVIQHLKVTNILYGLLINWCYQILMVVLICYFLKDFLTHSWRTFAGNKTKRNIKSILGGFGICFLLFLVARVIVLACSVDSGMTQNQSNVNTYINAFSLATTVLSVVVGPFTEECIYRGLIYHTLRKYSKVIAILVSALFFGLIHVFSTIATGNCGGAQIILLMIPYAIGGVGLGIVQEKYRNIWVNYLVHVLWNIMGTIPFLILALMK